VNDLTAAEKDALEWVEELGCFNSEIEGVKDALNSLCRKGLVKPVFLYCRLFYQKKEKA
jgi:hypothetical protein